MWILHWFLIWFLALDLLLIIWFSDKFSSMHTDDKLGHKSELKLWNRKIGWHATLARVWNWEILFFWNFEMLKLWQIAFIWHSFEWTDWIKTSFWTYFSTFLQIFRTDMNFLLDDTNKQKRELTTFIQLNQKRIY